MSIITRFNNGLVISRVCLEKEFLASAELIFEAWTYGEHLQEWWGPYHFTNPLCKTDVRKGGSLVIYMMSPDGMVFPVYGTFIELVKPFRIIFSTKAFEDNEGNGGFETLNTITLTPRGRHTLLTLESLVLEATDEARNVLEDMEESWKQSLGKLENYFHKLLTN